VNREPDSHNHLGVFYVTNLVVCERFLQPC